MLQLKSVAVEMVDTRPSTPTGRTYYEDITMSALQRKKEFGAEAKTWHKAFTMDAADATSLLKKEFGVDAEGAQKIYVPKYDFFTHFLNVSVSMRDPTKWALEWAKFTIALHDSSQDVDVIRYNPDKEGIKVKIGRKEDRTLSFKIEGELGPGAKGKTTQKVDDSFSKEMETSIGAKVSGSLGYDRKNGWSVDFEKHIEEIRGYAFKGDGSVSVTWDVYGDEVVKLPNSKIERTSVIHGSLVSMAPKGTKIEADLSVTGEIKQQKRFWFDKKGSIQLVGPDRITI